MTVNHLISKLKQPTTAPRVEQDDPDLVPIGVPGVLASSEKLLAINRGLAQPDERDNVKFKRLLTTDKLMAERATLDADKPRLSMLRRAAHTRSLKHVQPGVFDTYGTGLIVSNPLSMPLEEINPMHLVEQARRITHMGPGGLPSDDSITESSQSVHPSQFGFICPVSGPESSRAGVDVRMAYGVKLGDNGRVYQKFYDPRRKVFKWMSPQDLDGKTVGLSHT